jgi:ligand-binding sensor domain-containing protein
MALAMKALRRTAVAFGALAVLGGPVFALDPDRALTQYVRDSWTAKDGAPAGTITAIAQTPDGYLWLGTTSEGLFRFDGVRFTRESGFDEMFGTGGNRVNALLTDAEGTLWVGMQRGVARLSNGEWLEEYVSEHTQAEFSHGICPDCREKMRSRAGGAPPPA